MRDDDTSALVGGPIKRYGGKGRLAPKLTPHFAHALVYAEPFFGAGSVFYSLDASLYERAAVNDIDRSIVAFFRVLRDRTDDLVRACEFTPYSRDEFIEALEHSDDDLEEARRVWVRTRQGFSGRAECAGDWKRSPGDCQAWDASQASAKLASLVVYARRLRGVAVDNIDAAEFVDKWGNAATFVYCDPPYVAETRERAVGGGAFRYTHEMTDVDHRRLAVACRGAVERGAKVAVSGYPSALYDELFAGWRRVDIDAALHGSRDTQRRTECLWMSYPEAESFAGIEAAKRTARQPSLGGIL